MMIYQYSDHVVVVTHAFKKILSKRGVPEKKISVVLNGVDGNLFKPVDVPKSILGRKLVIGYFGTIGMAHGLESLLTACEILQDEAEILIVGSGAKKDELAALIEGKNLKNITVAGTVPKSQMPAMWESCDIALIPLRNIPLFTTVIPSKMFEAMAMGKPIIMAVPKGEATSIVDDHKVGISCAPENTQALVDAVRSLKEPVLYESLRNNCIEASGKFSRQRQALMMLDIVSRVKDHS